MAAKKSSLNIVELKKELKREVVINRALTTILIDRGILTRKELERMIEKLENEPGQQV